MSFPAMNSSPIWGRVSNPKIIAGADGDKNLTFSPEKFSKRYDDQTKDGKGVVMLKNKVPLVVEVGI